MARIFLSFIMALVALSASAQTTTDSPATYTDSTYNAEIACGECKFKMPGSGCDLAVRINGQVYFVDGSSIDDHGDAHAKDGLCKKITPALAVGHIENGRFKAKEIKRLPAKKG